MIYYGHGPWLSIDYSGNYPFYIRVNQWLIIHEGIASNSEGNEWVIDGSLEWCGKPVGSQWKTPNDPGNGKGHSTGVTINHGEAHVDAALAELKRKEDDPEAILELSNWASVSLAVAVWIIILLRWNLSMTTLPRGFIPADLLYECLWSSCKFRWS